MNQNNLLDIAAFSPKSLQLPNEWMGHLPFARWVIQEISPKILVELGTHSGNSYFAFCQSVVEAGISSRCYAVGTRRGDEHAGQYGEEIFAKVSAYHQEHYAGFSRLLRMSFDDAATYFSDESIDILHIDGPHTYDAVRHDFETWLPKLAPGAVVMFHDTNVRKHNFGVWILWEELQARYPNNLEFAHSNGLGVLQLNNAPDNKKLEWLQPGSSEKQRLINYFAALGSRQLERYELNELKQHAASLNKAVAERDGQIAQMRSSKSWRITLPLREMGRWTAAPGHHAKRYIKGALWLANRMYQSLPLSYQTKAAHRNALAKYFPRLSMVAESGAIEHLFDAQWYLDTYPDVRAAGVNPLLHYIHFGAAELRNPNPDFDAGFYVAEHPEAAANPLLYHAQYGALQGWQTHRSMDIARYLPHADMQHVLLTDVTVDIIVPVYRGLDETRRCLESVLSDTNRPPGTIRVIDDCSPEPELSEWLSSLAATGRIELSRNKENLGFVATVNRGMTDAGRHDVVLLNSDAEVPSGFLRRLASHAYARPKVASVTPFSNSGGELCSYPAANCGPMPIGYSLAAVDDACRAANGLRAVEIPMAVGFCMYIRRDCLDEVGLFDINAFGRGYGEETDFCMRASAAGWHHLLACDTFVYHTGEVSFGKNAPERSTSWNTLVDRYPHLPALLKGHIARTPTTPAIFSATVSLFRASALPTVLMVNHNIGDGMARHVDELVNQVMGFANVLLLCPKGPNLELCVPSIPGHPTLSCPNTALGDLVTFLHDCKISHIHIHHWIGFGADLHELVDRLGVPFDLTAHDYFSI